MSRIAGGGETVGILGLGVGGVDLVRSYLALSYEHRTGVFVEIH